MGLYLVWGLKSWLTAIISMLKFIYLGTNNDVSLEIKRRVTLANMCYFGLNRQLSSRDLSRATKLTLYKALILPVLLFGAEA